MRDFVLRTGLPKDILESLAAVDALTAASTHTNAASGFSSANPQASSTTL